MLGINDNGYISLGIGSFGIILMVMFWIAVIGLIIWLIRQNMSGKKDGQNSVPKDPDKQKIKTEGGTL